MQHAVKTHNTVGYVLSYRVFYDAAVWICCSILDITLFGLTNFQHQPVYHSSNNLRSYSMHMKTCTLLIISLHVYDIKLYIATWLTGLWHVVKETLNSVLNLKVWLRKVKAHLFWTDHHFFQNVRICTSWLSIWVELLQSKLGSSYNGFATELFPVQFFSSSFYRYPLSKDWTKVTRGDSNN